MSAPFGQSPATPQPGQGPSRGGGLDLGAILALVGATLGLIIYFCSFADVAQGSLGILGYLLLGGGLLAAATLLPKSPNALVPATVLAVVGALGVLASVVAVPAGLETPGIIVAILILSLLEAAVLVASTLAAAGVIKKQPRPAPFRGQQWGPQSGSFPAQQPGQFPPGQYGQAPPGQYGPGQPGQYPGQPAQPAQYGQPPQQSPPSQYGPDTAQFSPGDYGPPGDQPRPGEGGPGQQGQNPPYGQPGTPPGGVSRPDRS